MGVVISEKLRLVAAKEMLGAIGADDLAAAATEALVEGVDTPSVVRLAGMTGADSDEVRAVFAAALRELGIGTPTRREALMMLITEVARRITEGTISPYDGATEIWRLSLGEEDLPDLDTFAYVASEWEERPQQHKKWAAAVMAAASGLVRESHQ
jgi:hypothetical protein